MKKTSMCLFLLQTSYVESDLGHMLLYYHWPKHIPRKWSQPVQYKTERGIILCKLQRNESEILLSLVRMFIDDLHNK